MKHTSLSHLTAFVLAATALAAVSATALTARDSSAAPPGPAALAAPAAPPAPRAAAATPNLVERGRHLVLTSGCHDCHTPLKLGANGPEPDMTRALSGHPSAMQLPPAPAPSGPWQVAVTATNTAWSGPWGISYTANLTPDPDTGLGKWTKEEFVATLRTGRHLGRGREILPPMPIPAYSNFETEELEAMFAYLRTLPVVKNRVPEPAPPKPTR